MINLRTGRLELAEFGQVVSERYRILKCPDFEAFPRTCKQIDEIFEQLSVFTPLPVEKDHLHIRVITIFVQEVLEKVGH